MGTFNYTTLPASPLTSAFIEFNENSALTQWNSINYTFIANSTRSTLLFSIHTDKKHTWYIDNVVVVKSNNPTVSLLINGNFQYGNSTGWNLQGYSKDCSNPGDLIYSGSCISTWCYSVPADCKNYQFLQQSFVTAVGEKYAVSFDIKVVGSGGGDPSTGQVAIV